ncbi:hypothetical protein [Streptomyces sp. NPDC005077]|uniref:hypothetical protein n=1 Tax=Streptomyces sp. NPDC005077 TaxID=3154292 RepID=UPI0033B3F4A5
MTAGAPQLPLVDALTGRKEQADGTTCSRVNDPLTPPHPSSTTAGRRPSCCTPCVRSTPQPVGVIEVMGVGAPGRFVLGG